MKKLIITITLITSPILAQCDWNEDGVVDVLDIVQTVDCIMGNGECPEIPVYGCTDPLALNFDPNATEDDGSCEYDSDACVDIDGNVYSTVIIGIQEWMAENLKVIHYRNGDNIPTGHPNNEWEELNEYETGAYCVYEDEPINAEIYGNLYNKYAVDDDRGICPDGWHVPSDEEFIELELYLGMSEEVTHDYNWRGTNEGSMLAGNAELWPDNELLSHEEFGYSGFDAIPGGFRRPYGVYENIGLNAYFWTFTPDYSGYYWFREVSQFHSNIFRNTYPRQSGLSVRCVRD